MTELVNKTKKKLAAAWEGIREVTGDNAYELYVTRQKEKHPDCEILSREEFYRRRVEHQFDNKDNPSRCC